MELNYIRKFVKNIEADLANFRENGFMTICEPVEATAFGEKK